MKSFKDLEESPDIFALKLTTTTHLTPVTTQNYGALKTIWNLLNAKTGQGRPHTLKRILGLVCNACITHGQIEFLLSKDLLNGLIKQDKNIARGVLSGSEYNAFMRLAKDGGFLKEVNPPSSNNGKNLAGLYRLEIAEVQEFITSPEYEIGFKFKNEDGGEYGLENQNIAAPTPSSTPQAPEGLSQKEERVKSNLPLDDLNDAILNKSSNEVERRSYCEDHLKPVGDVGEIQRDLDREFLTNAKSIALGSLKNDELEKVAAALESALTIRHLFNAWGDLCLELNPSEKAKDSVVQEIMKKRFKDKSGEFAIGSAFFLKVESALKVALKQVNGSCYVPKRNCPPDIWFQIQKIQKVVEARDRLESAKEDELIAMTIQDEDRVLAATELTNTDFQLLNDYTQGMKQARN